MAIEYVHTYLVHPGKGADDAPRIGGTSVPLNGKLFRLLDNIYTSSDDELDIEISFNQGAGGIQQNDCRDLITAYLQGPTLPRGRRIAERLQSVTDRRSGLGLLFLMAGREGKDHKLVISRFPTDSAILAEEDQNNLTVELLERVEPTGACSKRTRTLRAQSARILPVLRWGLRISFCRLMLNALFDKCNASGRSAIYGAAGKD